MQIITVLDTINLIRNDQILQKESILAETIIHYRSNQLHLRYLAMINDVISYVIVVRTTQ